MTTVVSHLNASLAGRYLIEREIGAGGMATVYLATDIRHDRKVALKVLSPELGALLGVERFLAEIRVTANLQHPNLLPLFDSGEADGLLFYVMPYVEGESLRARLEREKQLPVAEAVSITVAIASALDYAHRHGVIHRDLKPENILLHEGQPLVADFGIALAVSNAGGNRITQTGLSLGTPQYMSPEQATGDRAIDGRTDIYSLGAMLYEMLVGDPPYLGGTAQAVIAKVLTERPRNVRLGRPSVPEHVDAAVAQALEKLAADRFATARELADALQGRLTHGGAAPAAGARGATPGRRRVRTALLLTTVISALALGALAGTKLRASSAPPPVPVRFGMAVGTATPIVGVAGATVDISNDGTTIAFVEGASRYVHVRRLNDLAMRPLEGTGRASFPAFSPDGRWIAFATPTAVKKVATDGGPAQTLTLTPMRADALIWPTADRLLAVIGGSLMWISANGGPPEPLAKRESAGVWSYQWARMLPDGETILFVGNTAGNRGVQHLGVMKADGSDIQLLDFPLYNVLGMVDDHLVYLSLARSIMAVRFDADRRRVTGAPVLLIENIVTGGFGSMRAALSRRGSLVYQPGAERMQMVLVAPGGAATEVLSAEAHAFGTPRFSPDGRWVAVAVAGSGGSDIWIYDVRSRTLQRLTRIGGDRPEWSADGSRVLFRHDADGGGEQIWWQASDGSAPAEPLQATPRTVPEAVMSADGRYLVYRVNAPITGRDIWYRAMSGDTTSRPLVATNEEELMPRLSPDGRWLAYVSTASGIREVYVQRFPGPGAVVQVSTGGGDEPLWSRDGRRLYYRNAPAFIAAAVAPEGDRMRVLSRTSVHEGPYPTGSVHPTWDVAPDGRLLVLEAAGDPSQLVVVHDWRTELLARLNAPR